MRSIEHGCNKERYLLCFSKQLFHGQAEIFYWDEFLTVHSCSGRKLVPTIAASTMGIPRCFRTSCRLYTQRKTAFRLFLPSTLAKVGLGPRVPYQQPTTLPRRLWLLNGFSFAAGACALPSQVWLLVVLPVHSNCSREVHCTGGASGGRCLHKVTDWEGCGWWQVGVGVVSQIP